MSSLPSKYVSCLSFYVGIDEDAELKLLILEDANDSPIAEYFLIFLFYTKQKRLL